MFRKLVSNLPFSPSLINQLGFYTKRLKKERVTRKLGLLFTILALIVQTLTIVAPAKATLAASLNDIMFGGGNKTQIAQALARGCDARQRCDLKAIYGAYGINSSNVTNAKLVSIYSSTRNNYWSIGRAPRGYGGEVAHQIPGGPIIYSRTLSGWATNKNWSALQVETSQGTRWILTDCGNIVTKEGQPKPIVQPPDVTVVKTVDKSVVNKGEKVTYTVKVTNIGKGTAKNVLVYDNAPEGLDLQNDGLGSEPIKSPRRWETKKRFDMAAGQSYTYKISAVVTKAGPTTLTNKACADILDTNVYNNCDDTPVTVRQPCPIPGKEHYPAGSDRCKYNPNLDIVKTSSAKNLKVGQTFEYTLKVTNKGDINLPRVVVKDIAPEQIEFLEAKEVGSNTFSSLTNKKEFLSKTFALAKKKSVTITIKAKVVSPSSGNVVNQACALSIGENTTTGACDETPITITQTCPTDSSLAKDSPNCKPCPIDGKSNLNINNPACKPCDETKQTQDGKDISCLELHKKARNITQQLDDATTKPAQAGDTVEYTLSVKNESKQTRKGFVIEENLEDVLEYADLQDASGATYTENPVRMLSWTPVDIKPNETVHRTILVKIKSPLPSTPASTSDPSSNDLKLVNTYGDTIEINLPPSGVKTVERTVQSVPSTGLGTNIIISTVVLMAATYFFFRSRLMVKELGLVREQFNYGAGA